MSFRGPRKRQNPGVFCSAMKLSIENGRSLKECSKQQADIHDTHKLIQYTSKGVRLRNLLDNKKILDALQIPSPILENDY